MKENIDKHINKWKVWWSCKVRGVMRWNKNSCNQLC